MPEGDIETYHDPDTGKWKNRVEAHGDLDGDYDRRDEAVVEGRDQARERKLEHLVHNLDGTIGERNSYGNDPRNIPG